MKLQSPTAYLIAWCSVEDDLLRITSAAITSEPPDAITHDMHKSVPLLVFKATGANFDEAKKHVLHSLQWCCRNSPDNAPLPRIRALLPEVKEDATK